MFEAKLNECELLKKILDGVKELVKDGNFEVTRNGLTLQAMDTSHVSLVHLSMRKACFDRYQCDTRLQLGLNLQNMSKILRCASSEDSVVMKAEEDGDNVTFIFESPDQDKYSEFELKLTEIEADELGIPETEYTAVIQLPSGQFKRICQDLSQLGDTVTISASKQGVTFSVNGEIGSGAVTIKNNQAVDEDESTRITLSQPVSLTFALKYLNHFCKSSPLDKQVSLSLSSNSPLLVQFGFSESGYIRYYLAPKIDEEEDADLSDDELVKEEDDLDDEEE